MTKFKLPILFLSFGAILGITMYFHAGEFGILGMDIFKIRGYKVLLLFVGSFGVGFATYIMQKMMKNNIIDSSFFGIASFNLFILVLVIAIFEGGNNVATIYKLYMPFISLAASILISLVMILTIFKKSAQKSQKIVLVGIIFNYLFMALAYVFMEKIDPTQISFLMDIGLGIVNEHTPLKIFIILVVLQAFTIVWYQLIYKRVKVSNISDKLSKNMGYSPKLIKIQQIIIVGINISISFSLIGGVAFLGIIAANVANILVKNSRWSAIVSGVFAAFVTALAYMLFNCFDDLYYPVGITTSLVTVPYFIYKVVRGRNA